MLACGLIMLTLERVAAVANAVGSTLGHSAEAAKRCGLHLFAAVLSLHSAGEMRHV